MIGPEKVIADFLADYGICPTALAAETLIGRLNAAGLMIGEFKETAVAELKAIGPNDGINITIVGAPTADSWDFAVFQLDCIRCLARAFDNEHDWEEDEDQQATHELLAEVLALHTRLIDALGPRPPAPEPIPADPDIPF